MMLPACSAETSDGDPARADEDMAAGNSAARRVRAEVMRDTAAKRGLTNGVLLAGIAQVETGFAHCWSEATWACKGPSSKFCDGGPVISGASDGPCDIKQGGLGMFQFDGGTHDQTLRRDGASILELDGNVSHAIDFVSRIVREELKLKSDDAAREWMNGVKTANGDATFEKWKSILACRYNGNCGGGRAAQGKKYGDATLKMATEFGGDFWKKPASSPPPATPSPPKPAGDATTCGVKDDDRLYCALEKELELHVERSGESPVVDILRSVDESWFECWAKGDLVEESATWFRTVGDDKGQRGWAPAAFVKTKSKFNADPSIAGLPACD